MNKREDEQESQENKSKPECMKQHLICCINKTFNFGWITADVLEKVYAGSDAAEP